MFDILFTGATFGIIIPMAVSVVLTILAPKTTTESLYEFTMCMDKGAAVLGLVCNLFFGVCLYFSTVSGQTGVATTGIFGLFVALGLLLIFATVPGFWSAKVKNDILYSYRFWVFRRSMYIYEIEKCIIHKGSIRVFKNGRWYIGIDSMCNNTDNFLQRMKKENIPVERA